MRKLGSDREAEIERELFRELAGAWSYKWSGSSHEKSRGKGRWERYDGRYGQVLYRVHHPQAHSAVYAKYLGTKPPNALTAPGQSGCPVLYPVSHAVVWGSPPLSSLPRLVLGEEVLSFRPSTGCQVPGGEEVRRSRSACSAPEWPPLPAPGRDDQLLIVRR
jgi:hypothetical protein